MACNNIGAISTNFHDVTDDYSIDERGHGNFPLLDVDVAGARRRFGHGAVADTGEVTPLRIGLPRLKNPEMADYLSLPVPPVVSSTIKNVLEPLNLACTQFVPASIRLAPAHDKEYWILHNYLELDVMDLETSRYELESEPPAMIAWIHDFRLSADKLNAVPLDGRLLFRDFRVREYLFWHKSLRDVVMAANPTGICFSPAHGRSSGDAFRDG